MDIAMMVAVVAGPVLAVEAQRILDGRRARKEQQLALFRALMASRVARAADPRHTEALNLIGVEFYKEKAVVEKWREYMGHLNSGPIPITDAWVQKFTDLFVELLHEIATTLGYKDIDKAQLRQGYAPKLYEDLEADNTKIRKGLVSMLEGKVSLPVHPGSPPEAVEPEPARPALASGSKAGPGVYR